MQPKVSVIVPVYKAEKYIERCCRSLFDQTLDNIEYIFVNDCTPDDSIKILNNIASEYPQRQSSIHIINHEKNLGQSGARRSGMSIATGEYIIHCDADDWVDIEMYEEMYLKAIETGADAVCCDMKMEFEDYSYIKQYNTDYSDHKLMYDCIAPIAVVYCSMCNRLISNSIFKNNVIIPFEGVNMWDDVGLTIRLRYFIKSNAVINKAFYHYNRSNETSTTKRPQLERVLEQIKCAQKIEQFFIDNGENKKYKYFIDYLKFKSKEELFFINKKEWKKTLPNAGKYWWKYYSHNPIKWWIRFILLLIK